MDVEEAATKDHGGLERNFRVGWCDRPPPSIRIKKKDYSSAELEDEELRERVAPALPRRWLPALRPERLDAELERDDFDDVDRLFFIRTSLASLSFSKIRSKLFKNAKIRLGDCETRLAVARNTHSVGR